MSVNALSRGSECVHEWTEWLMQCVTDAVHNSGRVCDWVSKCVTDWGSDWVSGWVSVWVSETHQWRRRACRKAERPSITRRMDTVSVAKSPNTGTSAITPSLEVNLRPRRITMPHRTSDSSETGSPNGFCRVTYSGFRSLRSRVLGRLQTEPFSWDVWCFMWGPQWK